MSLIGDRVVSLRSRAHPSGRTLLPDDVDEEPHMDLAAAVLAAVVAAVHDELPLPTPATSVVQRHLHAAARTVTESHGHWRSTGAAPATPRRGG